MRQSDGCPLCPCGIWWEWSCVGNWQDMTPIIWRVCRLSPYRCNLLPSLNLDGKRRRGRSSEAAGSGRRPHLPARGQKCRQCDVPAPGVREVRSCDLGKRCPSAANAFDGGLWMGEMRRIASGFVQRGTKMRAMRRSAPFGPVREGSRRVRAGSRCARAVGVRVRAARCADSQVREDSQVRAGSRCGRPCLLRVAAGAFAPLASALG